MPNRTREYANRPSRWCKRCSVMNMPPLSPKLNEKKILQAFHLDLGSIVAKRPPKHPKFTNTLFFGDLRKMYFFIRVFLHMLSHFYICWYILHHSWVAIIYERMSNSLVHDFVFSCIVVRHCGLGHIQLSCIHSSTKHGKNKMWKRWKLEKVLEIWWKTAKTSKIIGKALKTFLKKLWNSWKCKK